MLHESISLESLQTFIEVGRRKSFSQAAKALGVSPSAVSHRVSSFEELLGKPLLIRTTRSVRFTPTGKALFERVDAPLRQIHESVSQIAELAGARVLTVSCSPSFAIRFLLRTVASFSDLAPGIEVHIAADEKIADPRRDDIDVCIRFGAGKYPGLSVTRLTNEWVFPVCSKEYAGRVRLEHPSQLCNASLLHHDVMKKHPASVDWSRWLAARQLDPGWARRGRRFNHAHLALDAAVAGEGIALGRTTLVKADLEAGRLIAPFKGKMRSGLAYWLVTDRRPGEDATRFGQWLKKALVGSASR